MEIYKHGSNEQKRLIFSHVFQKLIIRGNVLEAHYTQPYELLAKAVEQTNRSKVTKLAENSKEVFEHQIIGSEKQKDQPLGVGHPTWLAGWNAFRTGEYLEGVEFPQTLVQQAQKILAIVATAS